MAAVEAAVQPHIQQFTYDKILSTCEKVAYGQGSLVTEKLGVRVVTLPSMSMGDSKVLGGFGEIKAPLHDVMDCCFDLERRAQWDTFFSSGRIVKEFPEVEYHELVQ